jgi:hypothetical protein
VLLFVFSSPRCVQSKREVTDLASDEMGSERLQLIQATTDMEFFACCGVVLCRSWNEGKRVGKRYWSAS